MIFSNQINLLNEKLVIGEIKVKLEFGLKLRRIGFALNV